MRRGSAAMDEGEKVARREVDERARRIAHELNNLFTCIRTSVTLLEEEEHDPERREDLERIAEATARATALARKLLSLTADGAEEESGASPRPGAGEKVTVLLVEHDPRMRVAAFRALKELGFRVTACGDGEEALELARERQDEIGLALLDLELPHKGARRTLAALKRLAPALPVVVAAQPDGLDEARALLDLGACTQVSKPYEADALAQGIERALARARRAASAAND